MKTHTAIKADPDLSNRDRAPSIKLFKFLPNGKRVSALKKEAKLSAACNSNQTVSSFLNNYCLKEFGHSFNKLTKEIECCSPILINECLLLPITVNAETVWVKIENNTLFFNDMNMVYLGEEVSLSDMTISRIDKRGINLSWDIYLDSERTRLLSIDYNEDCISYGLYLDVSNKDSKEIAYYRSLKEGLVMCNSILSMGAAYPSLVAFYKAGDIDINLSNIFKLKGFDGNNYYDSTLLTLGETEIRVDSTFCFIREQDVKSLDYADIHHFCGFSFKEVVSNLLLNNSKMNTEKFRLISLPSIDFIDDKGDKVIDSIDLSESYLSVSELSKVLLMKEHYRYYKDNKNNLTCVR